MNAYQTGCSIILVAVVSLAVVSFLLLQPKKFSPLDKYGPCRRTGGPGVPLYDCRRDLHSWYLQDGHWRDLGHLTFFPKVPQS